MKRLAEFEFGDYWIEYTPDKYLSPALLARKQDIVKKRQEEVQAKLEKEIADAEAKLKALKGE